jgi:hypothetical protein
VVLSVWTVRWVPRGYVFGIVAWFAGRLTPGGAARFGSSGVAAPHGAGVSAGWGWERVQALERGGELAGPGPVA